MTTTHRASEREIRHQPKNINSDRNRGTVAKKIKARKESRKENTPVSVMGSIVQSEGRQTAVKAYD